MVDRNDALKTFHDGGDAVADLLGERADATLPAPDSDVPMVSRSVRLPLDTYERVRAAAEARGLGVTTLMRQWIEASFDTLKDQLALERHGGRTPAGVYARVAQRLLALAAAIWHNWQVSAPARRTLITYDH